MRKSAATAAVEPRAARFSNVWEVAVNSNIEGFESEPISYFYIVLKGF